MSNVTETTAAQRIEAVCKELGLTMAAIFVPWSQSRNKDEKDHRGNPRKTLNWKVTILRMAMIDGAYKEGSGRQILTTDYSAGVAHCPAYKLSVRVAGNRDSIMRDELITHECERGTIAKPNHMFYGTTKIEPTFTDVIASITLDASVLDYATFEAFAEGYGYDPDSRKWERVYRECLSHALALRNAIGERGLEQLREACQDY